MTICEVGDKPKITYKFGTGSEKVYKSEYSPIEVVTQSLPAEANSTYDRLGYGLSISAVNGSGSVFAVAHEVIRLPPVPGTAFPSGGTFLRYMRCGKTTWERAIPCTDPINIAMNCELLDYNLNPGNFTILPNLKCATPNPEKCSIIIKYNEQVIFKDQGVCPITYSYECGNCPDGYEEIKTSTYPGYCCYDCASVKQELITIKNMVKRLNDV